MQKQHLNQTSDEEFFLEFYKTHKKLLFCLAQQYTTTKPDYEDIVHDAIVKLLNNVRVLRTINTNKAAKYISLTVKTVFLDRERSKSGVTILSLDDDTLEALLNARCHIPDNDAELSAYLEVEKLKASLSTRDWLVLEGKYILGYSQEELGKLIGVAPDSVRTILCRAKENARKLLIQEVKVGGVNYER